MSVKTWAGPGTSGNWGTVTNWTPLGVPAAGDDVDIPDASNSYGVKLDVATTPALDSVTIGGSSGYGSYLSIGANTLNVTGTGAGATDTITLASPAQGGPISSLGGGTIAAGNLVFSGGFLEGFGTLAISGNISGNGTINADGPASKSLPPAVGTLSVSGTIEAGVRLSITPAVANNIVINVLEILGTATSSWAIDVHDPYQALEIGPSGKLTINAAENIGGSGGVGGTIKLEGAGSGLILGSNPLTIGGILTGQGIVNTSAISGTGTVEAVGGTLELTQNVGASTGLTFSIEANSRLQFDGTVGTGNTFTFRSPTQAGVVLDKDAGFDGTFSNMDVGAGSTLTDFVDIVGHTVTIGSETGHGTTSGTVTLSDGAVLNLTNLTSPTWFAHAFRDGAGGTDVFVTDTPDPTPHDFNGDRRADIVLQNASSGQVWLWEMNGNSIIHSGTVATPDNPAWQVKSNGDVNGDGNADLVLQNNNSGQVWLWEMNGNSIIFSGNVATPDSPRWQVVGTGDLMAMVKPILFYKTTKAVRSGYGK